MSLINDALKRAKQSQQQNPTGALPLLPIETHAHGGTGWLLPMLAVLLVASACFFIGLAFAKRTLPAKNSENSTIAATYVALQKVETPATAPDLPKTAATAMPVLQTAAPVETNPPKTSEENSVAASLVLPELKVQGIFYDPTRPQAIVNGKAIGVGGRIGDFRVKAISPYRVTFVAPDGTEKISGLGE
jgi:hypothetical protein